MGCLCSKGISSNDYVANHVREKEINKNSKRFAPSLVREEVVAVGDNSGHEATVRLISKQPSEEISGSTPILWNEKEKGAGIERPAVPRLQKPEEDKGAAEVGVSGRQPQLSRIVSLSNGVQGAQAAAGWPSWLTAVAGEAIKGWLPRKAESFEKLDKIGQGTYSSVYKGRDLETGKIVAMKKVRFVNMDPESVRFMAREILILRRLDHPNVMKLEGLVTSRVSGSLYLIFEYMEHDLAGLAATPGIKFTEAQIKCYMQQLLCGLEHCHSRGILHRDIKGSNLLIDNNGNLKIGDFGLATFFRANQKQPLTSRVVTLWYRPPELLLGATDYGVSVDLWSSGCILAELFSGKPIMPGRTEVEQLHKIFKLCGSPSEEYWKKSKLPHATIFKPQNPYKRCVAETFKDFPSSALALLDVLLAIEPEDRGSASSALQSEFFRTKPLPSSPSSLPKYPPSKEFDAKLRDEEARRKKAAAKGRGNESSRKGSRESKAVPAPDANAELQVSIQKRLEQHNPKSNSEKYNPEEDGGSGFPIEPSRGTSQNGRFHSGQLLHTNDVNVNENDALMAPQRTLNSVRSSLGNQKSYDPPQGAAELSRFSNSVAVRGSVRETDANSHWGTKVPPNARYNQLDGAESSRKHDWFHRLVDGPKSTRRKDERAPGKESTMGYAPKNNRIHYSGPLMPPGGNLEEMLKEHERQIQNAVRKARFDKAKTKKTYNDSGQAEYLLEYGKNGR